ncbi:MAG: DNA polymerase, partial [Thermodesulfobacteriota bacterium]
MGLKHDYAWQTEPLYLVDGTSFLYRAFYAYPDLSRSDGFPTNALYITLRVLLKVLRQEEPKYLCFILDGREPGFRQGIMQDYKAQRLKMPEALEEQIPPLLQALSLLGIGALQSRDAEADDHIASLCHRFKPERPVLILGSDKDLQQCLDQDVLIWDPGQRSEKVITLQDFQEKQGLSPAQWPDYQALVGDKSDNIPGVSGIGPKTALQLLRRFPHLEDLKENLHLLPPKQQERLAPHLENAFLYRKLTTLRTDLEQDRDLQDFLRQAPQQKELQEFLHNFEFSSLYSILETGSGSGQEQTTKPDSQIQIQKLENELPRTAKQELGLYPLQEDLFCLGLEGQEYQVRMQPQEIVSRLNSCSLLFLPNYKELLSDSECWQALEQELIFDLALGAYLLDPEQRDYSWEKLCRTHAGQLQASQEAPGLQALELGRLLRQQLQQAGLLELMVLLELPLIPVLVRMEKRGVAVDLQTLRDFLQQVENQLQELTLRIQNRAGMEFNLRSPQQLAEVLFNQMGLKPGRKTPGGAPSTSSQVLEAMQQKHPIIKDILRHRSLEKLRS